MMTARKCGTMILITVLLLCGGCAPSALPLQPAGGETESPTMTSAMPTSTPPPSSPTDLPPSSRLGATLEGSGEVARSVLTFDDLMSGTSRAAVDDGAFALPQAAAMPGVVFEGRMVLGEGTSGFEIIRDPGNLASTAGRMQLPGMDLRFVQAGSYLVPVVQGLVYTGSPYWNYILGPGRIWRENGDQGYARASFPFALVERNQNCIHNGVMTFLFDGETVSSVRYQVTQETCAYFKFDLWGQAQATYVPESIPQTEALAAAHEAEVANRLPTRPIAALENDYPDVSLNLKRFGAGITAAHMSTYGVVINGVNYVSGCNTRHGEYAYCESLRLPSYSTAKSVFAGMALMRLAQKYGAGVADQTIASLVPEARLSPGKWNAVTLGNTLDMATGHYELPSYQVDEGGPIMLAFLDEAESYTDKMAAALRFPYQRPAGELWNYHTSDTFLAVVAMNNYLVQQEGNGADIFNLLRDEVYLPLGLSTGAMTSLRTDNSPEGAPFGGYGLFFTRDDIAKLGLFLNLDGGSIDGEQILHPDLLAAALQQNPDDRGLNTSGVPVFKYRLGFWAKQWNPSEFRQYTCSFWTPFMSGYGGITVVLIPSGSVYYYFSDNNEFSWYDAVNETNKIIPICP